MSVEGNATSNNELVGRIIPVPQVDTTLTKEGYSAEAKATGDKIKALEEEHKKYTLPNASAVSYDKTESGLASENTQEAIDEIAKNYLPKSGGELSGALKVKRYDNGFSTVDKNHSASADYGTFVADTSKDGKSAKVSVCALLGTFTYTDPDSNIRNVHHEGNKPFGNYTGNGSAVERTIETGGIGRLCLIYCSDYLVLATPKGAFKVTIADGTLGWIFAENLYYLNGKIIMATGGVAVNGADETYYYQVI